MRQHTPHNRSVGALLTTQTIALLHQAVAHANASKWPQAQALAERVLAAVPQEPSALNILGMAAMNNGRTREAVGLLERAAAGQPTNPFIQFNLGEAHRRNGADAKAADYFESAVKLKPDFADAYRAAGDALRAIGRVSAAERCFKAALRISPALLGALNGYGLLLMQRGAIEPAAQMFATGYENAPKRHPLRPILLTNLGLARLRLGQGVEGLTAFAKAVEVAPHDAEGWRRLASALRHTRVAPPTPTFREIVLQLFRRPDVNPRNLATAAIAVLRQDQEIDDLLKAIVQAPQAVAQTLEETASVGSRLVQDPLFQTLLISAPIADVAIELLLVQLRADLLQLTYNEPDRLEEELDLAGAIARQTFLNEYVFFADAEEESRVDTLVNELDRADLGARRGDAAKIALVAAYRPLATTPLFTRLKNHTLVALVDLLREQLDEPAEEARLLANLRVLKVAADATSLAVQQQYEESPYPRWTRCSLSEPLLFRDAIHGALPELPLHDIPEPTAPRVLIAGCGTGLEIMRVAGTYRRASMLAIDLSATSLAYAMRKTREYQLADVEYLQADILDLPMLSERFDLIDSFGVLHHMADPAAGLQVLARLLKPNGFLFVGLYSEIGRQVVVETRDHIKHLGFRDVAKDIRALRRQLILGASPALAGVTSPASDFWTLSDCRDLLFHVNEHRFTLPKIGKMFSAAGLEFLGVQFGHAADKTRYLAENQRSGAMRDLSRLHRHELKHPEIFSDTYRLWARPAVANAPGS